VHFLANELQVCTQAEAQNRYFFISAREMQDNRLKERGELRTTRENWQQNLLTGQFASISAYQLDGFQRRALEFKNFEEQFERCISKSATRTKFEAHSRRAGDIVEAIKDNLETTLNAATQEK
jgi:hypothetical protein